ncbi:MAG TPA: hypothetical protein VE439_10855 [Anaerolineae bacterium]|nr:hypothetical protein [Anaerolineae bacterium]
MSFLNKGKVLLLTALVFVLVLSVAPLALAAGYNDPYQYPKSTENPAGPHGGYTTTTNKCKECHAVHLATGSYMLTKVNLRYETCDVCHGVGGPAVHISLNEEGHGLSATQKGLATVPAPDDTTPTPYKIAPDRWGCIECHSVHDNNTVRLTADTKTWALYPSTFLLKKDPNPEKKLTGGYKYYTVPTTRETSQTVSHWCSTCHNANFGLHTDTKTVEGYSGYVYGHDSSAGGYTTQTAGNAAGYAVVDPLDGTNNGPTCKQCHKADGIGGSFPHSAENTPTVAGEPTAPDMLKTGTKPNQLDSVCSSCHYTPSLP